MRAAPAWAGALADRPQMRIHRINTFCGNKLRHQKRLPRGQTGAASREPPAQNLPSPEKERDPDDPATSPDPSSAKCDSAGAVTPCIDPLRRFL